MLLLTLLSNRYVWIALALAGMGIAVAYEKHRANSWEAKYEAESKAYATFRAEVAAAGMAADKAAREKEARDQAKTKEVRLAYEKTRPTVSSYWRLRDKSAGPVGGSLPRPAESPRSPDAAPAKPVDGGRSPTREDCAVDAAQLNALIGWIKEQNIPVE